MNRKLTIALLLVGVAYGCSEEIVIENQDATVTSVGPLSLDGSSNVVVPFTVRDSEGDDQTALVEICDGPDDNCLVASAAVGGDPMDRLPTVPRGKDVPHEFRWQPWCGRWTDSGLETADLEAEYVVAVSLLSSTTDTIYSNPFTIAELGASEAGECE